MWYSYRKVLSARPSRDCKFWINIFSRPTNRQFIQVGVSAWGGSFCELPLNGYPCPLLLASWDLATPSGISPTCLHSNWPKSCQPVIPSYAAGSASQVGLWQADCIAFREEMVEPDLMEGIIYQPDSKDMCK